MDFSQVLYAGHKTTSEQFNESSYVADIPEGRKDPSICLMFASTATSTRASTSKVCTKIMCTFVNNKS